MSPFIYENLRGVKGPNKAYASDESFVLTDETTQETTYYVSVMAAIESLYKRGRIGSAVALYKHWTGVT